MEELVSIGLPVLFGCVGYSIGHIRSQNDHNLQIIQEYITILEDDRIIRFLYDQDLGNSFRIDDVEYLSSRLNETRNKLRFKIFSRRIKILEMEIFKRLTHFETLMLEYTGHDSMSGETLSIKGRGDKTSPEFHKKAKKLNESVDAILIALTELAYLGKEYSNYRFRSILNIWKDIEY